ncbi:lysozyme g-like isoform X2 [Hemibagrus wyckioides]|uniref:lysozyme g-like isoform X2 n=1 Tax=Hemibagrus wyckioides TaxID=337641 RepID=UPI00266D0284|nr:lysozyme g-like isoform X2 [Hemibagrus wyckioides]
MACIYGDITKISTTGASEKTARQDKLTIKGVEASHKLAENDLRKMEQYKNVIIKVGRAKQMDPAVIAGGIAAYNLGPRNVRTYERMDIGSPGDDYSSDVVARAQFFKRKGY